MKVENLELVLLSVDVLTGTLCQQMVVTNLVIKPGHKKGVMEKFSSQRDSKAIESLVIFSTFPLQDYIDLNFV